MFLTYISAVLACAALLETPVGVAARMSEHERVEQWRKHHTWPPTWQPETNGYRQLMEEREREIMRLPGADERWENWVQYTTGRMVPTFTRDGYKVADVPKPLFEKLKAAVDAGVQRWDSLRSEGNIDVIYTKEDMLPKFVDMGGLAAEAMRELKPLHEEWAGGIKLRGTSSYGVRLYQNGSSLVMHHDKVYSHVISSIVHIAHQYDNESQPWPIEIENHRTGELVSVVLEPGQMLFYESAKCLHGRMTEFKGKYYGSIFIHYMPEDRNMWSYTVDDVINAIPPHWRDGVTEDHGEGWAGCSITVDSRRAAGAPVRTHGHTLDDPPMANEL